MSGILVPFVKQIVGYFVFQTEVLDGLTLRHRLRFVTDEQMLKIAAAIHAYWFLITAAKIDFSMLGGKTSKLDAYYHVPKVHS